MFIVNKGLSKSNIPRTIRFTEEIYNSLSDMASHEDISFNQLVLQCVDMRLITMEQLRKGRKVVLMGSLEHSRNL